jgi:twitching motility protein PilI
MNAYLYGPMTQVTFRTRVLVVDCEGIYSGVVVDDVMGLRHLREEAFVAEVPDMDEPLQPYVSKGCRVDDGVWGIFNLFSLIDSPGYLRTAV